ncbi:MAG: sulfotransferase [Opitutales bacterium]|jgi:hypothetical protein
MPDFLYREIFLGGAPKSGTTLLLGLLESHPDLLVFPEEVALFNRAVLRAGGRDTRALAQHILHHTEVRRLSEKGAPAARPGESENQVDYSFFNYPAFEKNFLARVDSDPAGGPRHVLQSLFHAYAETLDPPRDRPRLLVEKTPANDYFAPRLFEFFPDAKLVQVVRDPRAVYASRRQRLLHDSRRHSKAFRLVNEWNRSVYQRFEYKNHPARFLSVRYEDLVNDPRPVLERVCAFIGVDAAPLPLTPTRGGRAWGGNSSYGENFSGVSKGSLDRWKKELAPAEIHWIEYHCRAGMADCGYEILSDLSSPARNLARWLAPVPHESALGYLKARRGSLCWHAFPRYLMRPH